MDSACDQCAKPIKENEDSISCMAFCDRRIHLRCSATKLTKPFLNFVSTCSNLFWVCDECAKLMKCARFKSVVSSFDSVINSINERHDIAHAELKSEIAKQGEQIAQLSKGIALSTPKLHSVDRVRQPPLKRRRNEGSVSSKPLIIGTRVATDDNEFSEILTVPEPMEMFWLYLSRIHPSVKPESIEKLVRDCVQNDGPIKVIPLVKKGADISRMSFISYKVGMDPKLREVALSSNTWPRGILFREFEDSSSKNMWMPAANTPAITISPTPDLSQFSTPTSGLIPVC